MQHGIGQAALPPGGVCGEPGTVFLGAVVPAVEGVAVRCHSLCLEGFVRPADRHFGGNGTDEIFPQRQLYQLPGALVGKADDIGSIGSGRRSGRAVLGQRGGGGRCGVLRGILRKRCAGNAVGGQRQGTAQHQQNGAQQQKGFFHGGILPENDLQALLYGAAPAHRCESGDDACFFAFCGEKCALCA